MTGIERVPGLVSPYTPITEKRATANRARLAAAINGQDSTR